MPQGKLQLGAEAVPVEYKLQRSQGGTTGILTLMQTPLPGLAKAILNVAGANLITESGQPRWIEFRRSVNGLTVEFIVPRLTGRE
jgi:hypothetical protein